MRRECCKCDKLHTVAPGHTSVVVAHVHNGKPCTDIGTASREDFTRSAIETSAHMEGIPVDEWQQRNLDDLEL